MVVARGQVIPQQFIARGVWRRSIVLLPPSRDLAVAQHLPWIGVWSICVIEMFVYASPMSWKIFSIHDIFVAAVVVGELI